MTLSPSRNESRLTRMLDRLKDDAVMSKFASQRDCEVYRSAIGDVLNMVRGEGWVIDGAPSEGEAAFLRRLRDAIAPWDGLKEANVIAALDMIGDRLIGLPSALSEKVAIPNAVPQGRSSQGSVTTTEDKPRGAAPTPATDPRDAERYRFLRQHITFTEQETLSPMKRHFRRWYHDTAFKPEADTAAGMFDAAIDAAIDSYRHRADG